ISKPASCGAAGFSSPFGGVKGAAMLTPRSILPLQCVSHASPARLPKRNLASCEMTRCSARPESEAKLSVCGKTTPRRVAAPPALKGIRRQRRLCAARRPVDVEAVLVQSAERLEQLGARQRRHVAIENVPRHGEQRRLRTDLDEEARVELPDRVGEADRVPDL